MIRVFDTSALIYDPSIITEGYPGDDIVIPMTVLKELEENKSKSAHPGAAAREVIRNIASFIGEDLGGISEGVTRDIGGSIRVEMNHINDESIIPDNASVQTNDDRIILVSLSLAKEQDDEVILVTQDYSMSIIAEVWGVNTVRHEIVDSEEKLPRGIMSLDLKGNELEGLHSREGTCEITDDVPVNTGVILSSGSHSGIGIADGKGRVSKISDSVKLHGVAPRNTEQKFAANLLMGDHNGSNEREFLGSLSGRAGAGKTLLALSAGVKRVLDKEYDGIIIYRPTEPVGRDMGYLPGNLDEKMEPWTAAIEDVLEVMRKGGENGNGKYTSESVSDLISIESANFVRGRTLRNKWVIIEEAQNYEPVVLRTLLSRAGEGTAVILTWDPTQVDNLYLRRNAADAPMSVLKNLLGSPMVWHIELTSPERGGVSALID